MAITKVKTLGITDANVTAAKLSTDSVETAKITASNVTNAKLGSDISAAKLTAGTISGDRLPAPTLTIKGDGSSADGKLILNCSQNSHGVSIQAPPHSAAQSYNLVLPSTAPGANKILQTDGSGNLSWVDQGASGKIGQVLQATFTGTQTIDSATTWTDVTSLTQAITPAATSSKILVMWSVNVGSTSDAATRLIRGSTAIAIGDAAGSRGQASTDGSARNNAEAITHSMMWLDSPSTTSATTYKIQAVGGSTTINMSDADSDSFDYFRTVSTLTVMEILA